MTPESPLKQARQRLLSNTVIKTNYLPQGQANTGLARLNLVCTTDQLNKHLISNGCGNQRHPSINAAVCPVDSMVMQWNRVCARNCLIALSTPLRSVLRAWRRNLRNDNQ